MYQLFINKVGNKLFIIRLAGIFALKITKVINKIDIDINHISTSISNHFCLLYLLLFNINHVEHMKKIELPKEPK
ncbi:hypothetical protein SG0102_23230 [Intestinibaculum porci]|uniref:Uncharacterized protein n=1 Tax=Intestinibaculum porci TaxID=2487118 RepID=A0A3G9JWE5_9FIRM|nr:hypothetical protein SG0102_23230 [Intestinibaculum porci]